MKKRSVWINNNFIDKELYAPFVVNKDIEYLSDLKRKYKLFLEKALLVSADEKSNGAHLPC